MSIRQIVPMPCYDRVPPQQRPQRSCGVTRRRISQPAHKCPGEESDRFQAELEAPYVVHKGDGDAPKCRSSLLCPQERLVDRAERVRERCEGPREAADGARERIDGE